VSSPLFSSPLFLPPRPSLPSLLTPLTPPLPTDLIDRIAAGDDIRDDVVYDRSLLGDEAEWDNYEDEDDDEFGEEEEEEGEEGDLSEEDERRLKDLLKF
jgi:hypothetical protein